MWISSLWDGAVAEILSLCYGDKKLAWTMGKCFIKDLLVIGP